MPRFFSGKTFQQIQEAYQAFKESYKAIGTDILFDEKKTYLMDDLPLVHGITVGDMEQFLSIVADPIECKCGFYYNQFEPQCPCCLLKIRDYKAYLKYMRGVG